ncbi:hypothetical protein BpHYR1_050296 [Brachionus plicatilis]|uniref:Uncharacterized protein n=1 Tax=Brachionus plicatilis TaxID=10195 RepID=A0A3M7R497_BRAPC|nr:hypothetical protein BpHYR1_050296 [Brachionus plicatilis]
MQIKNLLYCQQKQGNMNIEECDQHSQAYKTGLGQIEILIYKIDHDYLLQVAYTLIETYFVAPSLPKIFFLTNFIKFVFAIHKTLLHSNKLLYIDISKYTLISVIPQTSSVTSLTWKRK